MAELAIKVRETVAVPSSVLSFIIGSKGKNLKSLCERTGANIQVPKRDESATKDLGQENDEIQMISVTIDGDFEGAAIAKAEINHVVDEKTSQINVRMNNVPPEYFALLAGANQQRVAQWEDGKDLKVRIPPYYATASATSTPAITLSGHKTHVNETKTEIERLLEHLQSTHISAQISIPKRQHRFLVGDKGKTIQSILEQSGCAVILPPQSENIDHVRVIGPSAQIADGFRIIMDKANSTQLMNLDIAKAHAASGNPRVHARDLTRYLQKARELQRIEKQFEVQISVPNTESLFDIAQPSVMYEFAGKTQESVSGARQEVVRLVNTHTPDRFVYMDVDPLHHRHIIGAKGRILQRAKDQHHVDVLFGNTDDGESQIVLVYEGEPQTAAAQRNEALQSIKAQFEKIASEQANLESKTLTIPGKHHQTILGPQGTTLNAITGGSTAVVHVRVGLSRDGKSGCEDTVVIRGPSAEVNRVAKEIQQVVEEAKHHEVMSSYNVKFDFPKKFVSSLVGRSGQNISKLRDELGVSIGIEEGSVSVTGIKKNVEEAKVRILALAERLEDETTLRIPIPNEFHSALIGQKGKFARRLEEKYSVRVQFPRATDDFSGETHPSRPQNKNEVVVQGGRKGAADVKEELIALMQYEQEMSNTTTFELPKHVLPWVIGKEGQMINAIKDKTETRIDVDSANERDTVRISIRGTKSGIAEAQSMVKDVAAEAEEQKTRHVDIDSKYHGTLIGAGGSNLRDMIVKAGGPTDRALQARMIKFPRGPSAEPAVILNGPGEIVDAIATELERQVAEIANRVEDEIQVPQSQHRRLIGREGAVRRDLERRHQVTLVIPRLGGGGSGPAEDIVRVQGRREGVDQAREEILRLVATGKGTVEEVPRSLHALLAERALVRQLKKEFGVVVEHGRIPMEPPRAPAGRVAFARIDDDDDAPAHAWDVTEETFAETGPTIAWTLRGKDEDVARAQAHIREQVEQVRADTCIGFLTLPDSGLFGRIIGPGGRHIAQIRDETKCTVHLPRSAGEPIVVRGSREGVERAREMIEAAVAA